MYGDMTSVTVGDRTSVTAGLVEFWAEEAQDDALGEDGCERTKSAVRGARDERQRVAGGSVPRVWDFPTDGISLATQISAGRQHHGRGGAQPAARAESGADGAGARGACGGVAAAVRMGCQEDRGAAARRRSRTAGADHPPYFEATRTDRHPGCASTGTATLRALGRQRALADGRQGRIPGQRWDLLSALHFRRP